uniref:C2H2-type domain-containing protein n=1 Tax=Hucho hucho TaxID=62062 RepID=A0A4W5Q7K9_9TELE
MSFELAFRCRVASIMETLTATALQDICQLMGETYAALRVEMVHEQNQSSKTKLQAMENGTGVENPANCMERIQKLISPPGLRNFPVVEQILNEQEANGLWLEVDPTVEDEGPPSLVPEGEEPALPLSQTTDMGVETWPAPPVIKQEEMDDDDMESQGYGEWIPETDKANQNTRGESDEEERSPASGGSIELGVDDFKREQSPLLVSAEDAPAPTKMKINNVNMYTCEIFGKIETKKGTMTSHMIKHTGLPFSCDICGKKFKRRDFLTKHKHSNHYTGIIYSCSVCEKTFQRATSRDTHERGHTGKNYWCSDCGETFKERQDRDTHDCIVYKGERPFSCSKCNEDFERQYHLKKHQLEKHPLLVDQTVHCKPRCSVCGKVFTYMKWLIRHERTHKEKNERRDRDPHESIVEDPINEQPESKDLKAQFEPVESSEAPIRSEPIWYNCDICGTRWATKSSMRSHMVIHRKKHYTCDVCGKVFRLKSLFTIHQLRHKGFKSQYQLKKHQLEKQPLKVEQPCSEPDTAMVVQGAQPSTDSDFKTDMSALGGSSSGPTDEVEQ